MAAKTIKARQLRPGDRFTSRNADVADYIVIRIERLPGSVRLDLMDLNCFNAVAVLYNGELVEIVG